MMFDNFNVIETESGTVLNKKIGEYIVTLKESRNDTWIAQVIDHGSNFLTSKFVKTWDDEQSHPMTANEVNEMLEKIQRHSSDI